MIIKNNKALWVACLVGLLGWLVVLLQMTGMHPADAALTIDEEAAAHAASVAATDWVRGYEVGKRVMLGSVADAWHQGVAEGIGRSAQCDAGGLK
jgi:hypothetical protein